MTKSPNTHGSQPGMTLLEIIIALLIAGIMSVIMMPKLIATDKDWKTLTIGRGDAIIASLSNALKAYQDSTGASICTNPTPPAGCISIGGSGTFHCCFENPPVGCTQTGINVCAGFCSDTLSCGDPYSRIVWDCSNSPNYNYYTNYRIFREYGVYLARKGSNTNPLQFFLLHNNARITFAHQVFSQNSNWVEYMPPPLTSQYNKPSCGATPCPDCPLVGGQQPFCNFCGDYANGECVWADLNGKAKPNKVGSDGDLMAFRIDCATGTIKSLYEWERDQYNPTDLCDFVSSYDKAKGSACP